MNKKNIIYTDQDRQDIAFIAKEICKDFIPFLSCYPEQTARYYFWESLNEDVNKRHARFLMQFGCSSISNSFPLIHSIEI